MTSENDEEVEIIMVDPYPRFDNNVNAWVVTFEIQLTVEGHLTRRDRFDIAIRDRKEAIVPTIIGEARRALASVLDVYAQKAKEEVF